MMRIKAEFAVPGVPGRPETWCCSECDFLLTEMTDEGAGVQTCALFGMPGMDGDVEELQIQFDINSGARIEPCQSCRRARAKVRKEPHVKEQRG